MQIACPRCGSSDIRSAHRRSFVEVFEELVGVYPLRCRSCSLRFKRQVWSIRSWVWAKCPRCYRMDLTFWSEEYYRVGRWASVQLAFGAKRVRCDYCRCNFVSFRPVRKRRQPSKSMIAG